jgi:hypothetical protein
VIAASPVGETSLPGAQADNKASTKAANVDLETMCSPLLRLTRVAIETPSVIPVAPPPFDRESRIVSHLPSPITVAPIRCFREHYRSPAQRGNGRRANGTLQHDDGYLDSRNEVAGLTGSFWRDTLSSRNHRASALSKFRMPHKLDFRHF